MKITVDTDKPLDREQYIALRDYFEDRARIPGQNPSWNRTYLNIADAIDKLDAMIARITVKEDNSQSDVCVYCKMLLAECDECRSRRQLNKVSVCRDSSLPCVNERYDAQTVHECGCICGGCVKVQRDDL